MSGTSDRRFHTTRWTLVLTASRDASPQARVALGELCTLYWSPLYAFARRQGHSAEQAQDLTQSFFTRLIEKNVVAAADPARGRFRSFLLASFKHFLANEWDREHARKRGGEEAFVPLDVERAEAGYLAQQPESLGPDAVFERQWALDVLGRVVDRLRREYAASGKAAVFEALSGLVTGDAIGERYADIARTLRSTEGAMKVMAHRLRRRYADLLREEIAATVSDTADVDDEIQYIIAALGRL
jgi:RNA polymerase sigma-70 factor (ECF subfamily)